MGTIALGLDEGEDLFFRMYTLLCTKYTFLLTTLLYNIGFLTPCKESTKYSSPPFDFSPQAYEVCPPTNLDSVMAQAAASAPQTAFGFEPGLAEWNVPAKVWLASNEARLRQRRLKLDNLATGAVVFNPEGKVLVVQRASHDSTPNLWEIPGGAVDQDDPTVLHGAARELWEEAGLVATHFRQLATASEDGSAHDLAVFSNRNGTRWYCRFAFHVDVESCQDVRLDPAEHQAFAWASEEEIREQRIGSRELPITYRSMQALIIQAFKSRRGCRMH